VAEQGRDLLLGAPAQGPHPDHVASPEEVAARILAFQDHHEQIAHPFEWKFGRRDLDRMLAAASSPAPSVSVA